MTRDAAKTRGLFLGKFLPPHKGHIFVAETALSLVDELTVLVCSLPDDPIDGATRASWMEALLPGAQVIHFGEVVPQEPKDHPDFWTIWRELIMGLHPAPLTHVFGSDPYIHQLGAELGARPMLIDPDRECFPVSGTAVRARPLHHWTLLPDTVRRHYAKRVCVFGPESTGKSTLVKHLAAVFETSYLPEYGRIYDEQYRPSDWSPAHLVEIAEVHQAMRDAMLAHVNRVLIEDTDALLTKVWSTALAGAADPWFDQQLPLADLYLLTDIDVPWVDDGLRLFGREEERRAFFEAAKAMLDERGANYHLLSGSFAEREARAEALVRTLLEDNEDGSDG